MLTVATGSITASPPRRPNAGRWVPARLAAARTGAAVKDAGDVTSDNCASGYAVRREWADGRHDLFGFTPDAGTAQRHLGRDQGFWRGGPVRPTAVYVVAASVCDVDSHPVGGCWRSWCPDSPERGQWR